MKKIVVFLLACVAVFANAAPYQLVDLGTLGGTESFAHSISDSKMILGRSRLPGDSENREVLYYQSKLIDVQLRNCGNIEGAFWSGLNNRGQFVGTIRMGGITYPGIYDYRQKSVQILGSLGGVAEPGFTGAATAINQAGDVVGYSHLDSLNRHAFVWSRGVMTDLGSFGGYSVAMAINNRRTIVGWSSDEVAGRAVAFVYQSGQMIPIDPFGGGESYARDVNDNDEVVGSGLTPDHTQIRAFVWKRGRVVDLGALPGGRTCDALAINNRGMVVGVGDRPVSIETRWDYESGIMHTNIIHEWQGFLHDDAGMRPLNELVDEPDWNLTWATDINEAGDIVGQGLIAGKFRAFLLTKSKRGAVD